MLESEKRKMAKICKVVCFTIILVALVSSIFLNIYLANTKFSKKIVYAQENRRSGRQHQTPYPKNYGRNGNFSWTPSLFPEPQSFEVPAAVLDPISRRKRVLNCCKIIPSAMPDRNRMKALLRSIIVVDEYKLLYCVVPKVGCTNWKRVVKMLYGTYRGDEEREKMHNRSDFVYLNQFSNEERNKRLKSYYKFMFVRQPLVRLYSAYQSKFVEDNEYFRTSFGEKILKHSRPEFNSSDDVKITFNEFMKYLAETPVRKMNEHWMPMHEVCHPCWVNYDFIGSLENIEEDSSALLQTISATSTTSKNATISFPQKQAEYHTATQDELGKNFRLIPKSIMETIVSKYLVDFHMFGYKLP